MIIGISLIIFLYLYFKPSKAKNDVFQKIKIGEETINYEGKFDYYIDAFNKARGFIDKNIKGILTEKIKISIFPKISAVVPCFNCKNYIIRSIRSIQNQNFSDFEIVIVNDNSTDDTLSFLEKLHNEDSRIKILNNKKKMGTLYTRTIGTLSTKGKYIFPFDSDDMFLDKDVFWTISSIADKGNFDIIVFDFIQTDLLPSIDSPLLKFNLCKIDRKPNIAIFQPELGYHPIRPAINNIKNIEILFFARCIKSNIYKKALNKLGISRYSRFMHLVEDIINNYIIFNTAKSMLYIQKCGYIYIQRYGSQSHLPVDPVQFLIYRIYLLDVLIEFSKDSFKHKQILVQLIFFCLGNKNLQKAFNRNSYNFELFISCLNRILSCNYIAVKDKDKIRKKAKFLKSIKSY